MVKKLVFLDGDVFNDGDVVALNLSTQVDDLSDRDSQPPCVTLCLRGLSDTDTELLFVLNEKHLRAISTWIDEYFKDIDPNKKLESLGMENR